MFTANTVKWLANTIVQLWWGQGSCKEQWAAFTILTKRFLLTTHLCSFLDDWYLLIQLFKCDLQKKKFLRIYQWMSPVQWSWRLREDNGSPRSQHWEISSIPLSNQACDLILSALQVNSVEMEADLKVKCLIFLVLCCVVLVFVFTVCWVVLFCAVLGCVVLLTWFRRLALEFMVQLC